MNAGPGGDQVARHSAYVRVVHWAVAIFFVLSLLSGLAIYTPWLFAWVAPLFGGGARTRQLHPYFSVAFVVCFALQFVHWVDLMRWRSRDTAWVRNVRAYVTNTALPRSAAPGFFNGGQKAFFWTIVVTSIVFVVTGLAMWFPAVAGRGATAVSYVLHDVAMLVMLGAFIAHIYMSTAQQPGTFRAMVRGTVSRRWVWTHHPAWQDGPGKEGARTD